jgi:hypothetical protein
MEDGPLAVLEEIRGVCLVKIVPIVRYSNGSKKFLSTRLKIEAIWNAPIFGWFGIISMLFSIRHGVRPLSGERGCYILSLIRRWQNMVPSVLRPDVGVLGKKSEITSKMSGSTDDLHGEGGTFLEPKGGLDALISCTEDVSFGIMLLYDKWMRKWSCATIPGSPCPLRLRAVPALRAALHLYIGCLKLHAISSSAIQDLLK